MRSDKSKIFFFQGCNLYWIILEWVLWIWKLNITISMWQKYVFVGINSWVTELCLSTQPHFSPRQHLAYSPSQFYIWMEWENSGLCCRSPDNWGTPVLLQSLPSSLLEQVMGGLWVHKHRDDVFASLIFSLSVRKDSQNHWGWKRHPKITDSNLMYLQFAV